MKLTALAMPYKAMMKGGLQKRSVDSNESAVGVFVVGPAGKERGDNRTYYHSNKQGATEGDN